MKFKHPLIYLLLAIVIAGQAGCQKNESGSSHQTGPLVAERYHKPQTQDPLQAKIKEYLLSNHINGNVAIVKDNKLIFNEGVGYADFQKKEFNRPSTTHPIGSITKSFVATAVMQLQEKGKLNIYDPVAKYLPDFPNGKNIKLVHLLTHTSGIHAPLNHIKAKTLKGLIKAIEKQPIKFPAGERWNYRDENYVILGYIVEKAAGTSLHQYIEKNIFAKAGMKHSGFITKKNPDPFTSVGYLRAQFHTLSTKKIHPSLLFGYADIYSTAHDICLYDMALMSGKLVSKRSLKEILTPGSQSLYGLGLYNYGYAVYSRGVVGGWEALHVYYQDKTSIALLLNVRDKNVNIRQISKDIFQILDAETPAPRTHAVGISNVIPKVFLL